MKTTSIIKKIKGKAYVRFKNRYSAVVVPVGAVLALCETADEMDVYIKGSAVQFLFSDVTTAVYMGAVDEKSCVTIRLKYDRHISDSRQT